MAQVKLDYRHCDRMRPLYLRHAEVEDLAQQVRSQLIDDATRALSVDVLRGISRLVVNDIAFELFVSVDATVHDEQGEPVFGICEYDPGVPDTAMVSVSPIDGPYSEELTLSTLAHELGHATMDAPAWIAQCRLGPGLFDNATPTSAMAYRTTTRGLEHLAEPMRKTAEALQSPEYFAELRANEFMGSLLVPRGVLAEVIHEMAPAHGLIIEHDPMLDLEHPTMSLRLPELPRMLDPGADDFVCELAKLFGVTPRFIQVRLERYGMTSARRH